jgi:3-oxocholest-4-en-26-oyl-CoA dehydrogenase beta subunit
VDFSFSEDQEALAGLAAQVFDGRAPAERVRDVEATDERFDRELWAELATTGLLGIGLPEAHGGNGLGLVEVALVLQAQGRRVAPVPYWATVVLGALPIARFGSPELQSTWLPRVVAGEAVLTAALETGPGSGVSEAGGRLFGELPSVPALPLADAVVVPAGGRLFLVEAGGDGVQVEPCATTSRAVHGHLRLDGVPGEPLGGDLAWVEQRALVGLAAIALGVGEEAIRLAADYTSNREQFGRPLSTNQGVVLKAADAYIALEAMRATLWQAAWRLDEGLDAAKAVEVAKWWASDGGNRVVHVTQHLHGGMGADIDYPVHRYFLWGKHLCDLLGGPSQHLARLGDLIAEEAKARA